MTDTDAELERWRERMQRLANEAGPNAHAVVLEAQSFAWLALRILEWMLRHPNGDVARRAALTFWHVFWFAEEFTAQSLVRALGDKRKGVREGAVASLLKMGNLARHAISRLPEASQNGRNLAYGDTTSVAEQIEGALRENARLVGERLRGVQSDPWVAEFLLLSLADLGSHGRSAASDVVARSQDASPAVRLAAMRCIGRIGSTDEGVVAAVRRCLRDDPDPEVRAMANWALSQLQSEGRCSDRGPPL